MLERGVKGLQATSVAAQGANTRAATSSEACSLDKFTNRRPSRSFHGEGNSVTGSTEGPGRLWRGTGSSTCVRGGVEHERPVCTA
jgi:hypothetical protein